MEAALRSSTNSSDSVNMVTTLPFCRLVGMAGSRLVTRTRYFEGRLQHRQWLAMGGLLLIHEAQHGHQSRFVALPCECQPHLATLAWRSRTA